MTKEKIDELIGVLLKIKRLAAEQNIHIEEVSLPSYWTPNPLDTPPNMLLGVKTCKIIEKR